MSYFELFTSELSHLEFTGKASTALAFVSLAENGERTFSFCRKPSADLLYAPEQIDPGWFSQAFALHFCSVSLVRTIRNITRSC